VLEIEVCNRIVIERERYGERKGAVEEDREQDQ